MRSRLGPIRRPGDASDKATFRQENLQRMDAVYKALPRCRIAFGYARETLMPSGKLTPHVMQVVRAAGQRVDKCNIRDTRGIQTICFHLSAHFQAFPLIFCWLAARSLLSYA